MNPSIYTPGLTRKPRKNCRFTLRVLDTDLMHLDRLVKYTNKTRLYQDRVDRSKLVREMITRAADSINQLELDLKKK